MKLKYWNTSKPRFMWGCVSLVVVYHTLRFAVYITLCVRIQFLSKALYHSCFICGQVCKWWSCQWFQALNLSYRLTFTFWQNWSCPTQDISVDHNLHMLTLLTASCSAVPCAQAKLWTGWQFICWWTLSRVCTLQWKLSVECLDAPSLASLGILAL